MSYTNELDHTLRQIAISGKGILAADESTATITKRFQAVGIESSEQSRLQYREMLLATPGINEFIAGVILFEETLNQRTSKGSSFPDFLKSIHIVPGIKVDKGLVQIPFTNEQVTQGLDGLAERLVEYKKKGAQFAKWRAVYDISANTPSSLAIAMNAEVLARYAAICQSVGIVPIVEPEVLIDGNHTLERCEEVSTEVLQTVFHALAQHHVTLEHIILKPNMVINGKSATQKASIHEVAQATLRVLLRTVPAAVPTINFLSGGQSSEQATAHLNLMNQAARLPWNLSYSYARALQDYAMKIWKGDVHQVGSAQQSFYKRARLNSLAAQGKYAENMEHDTISMAINQ